MADQRKTAWTCWAGRLTPDLRLYLLTDKERIEIHKFSEEPVGDFVFDLPSIDVEAVNAVDLYCVFCERSFGVAQLEPLEE